MIYRMAWFLRHKRDILVCLAIRGSKNAVGNFDSSILQETVLTKERCRVVCLAQVVVMAQSYAAFCFVC